MKVLLIQTKVKESEKSYPLGLSYVGAELVNRGHKVWGRDLSFTALDKIYSLIDCEGIDLIVVSAMSYGINYIFYDFNSILSFCRKIKDNRPLPIILGGLYARALKEKIFYDYKDYFDYLILKEDENSISELTDCLGKGKLPREIDNLIFKNNGQIIINESSSRSLNLDCYPFPDRQLFPIFKYKGMFIKGKNYTQIITSRGCNQHCRYCSWPLLQGKWRGISIDKVIDEIGSVIDIFGIREFHIEDENFFGGGTKRVKDFCRKLIDNKLMIKWQCPNGIPVAELKDDSVFELMAKAGCYSLCLGIETFDQEILKTLGRDSDFEATKKIIKSARNAGLEITGYFIIGFPGQTKKSIRQDVRLSRKLGLDFMHYSIFRLIPGSAIYFDSLNRVENSESKISLSELKKIRTIASLFSCVQPRVFLSILKSLITAKNLFRFLRRGANYLLGTDFRF